ncbi:hypothetical protein TBR22_A47650 [Luteitalea sp. TBR-22]|uniref:hypothetical protein n=1 Tax=Luteitalea sp. TBR-22 TaxID=2802971 RepID=UPI001AF0EAF1|nr:hypothetical protein [Luteitalea sp. TBR-22]BCS35532.1 hypothetical protein TBR22_A47650 [Luteitalea sp. TBR-22]
MTPLATGRPLGRDLLLTGLALIVTVAAAAQPVPPDGRGATALAPAPGPGASATVVATGAGPRDAATPTDPASREAFLRTARIAEVRGVKVGVTGTRRATLQDDTVTHDASIQLIDQALPRFQSASRIELNFRDYWGYNVAAYRLAVRLALDNVPVSVARRFRGEPAAFTWWVDEVLMDERTRQARQVAPPDGADWNAQIHVQRVFDELIANTDRNQGNLLIDRHWKLWLIDHSRAFRLNTGLRTPATIRRCDRALLAAMKALTREAVDAELGDVLTGMERDALMARRDALIAHVEALGPAALYDRTRE